MTVISKLLTHCNKETKSRKSLELNKQELFREVDVIYRGQSARENPLMQIRRHLHNHVSRITYTHVHVLFGEIMDRGVFTPMRTYLSLEHLLFLFLQ